MVPNFFALPKCAAYKLNNGIQIADGVFSRYLLLTGCPLLEQLIQITYRLVLILKVLNHGCKFLCSHSKLPLLSNNQRIPA